MRDKEAVSALFGRPRQHLAKCRCSPTVFVGRHDQTALRQVDCLLNVLKSGEEAVSKARLNLLVYTLPAGDAELTDCIAERFCTGVVAAKQATSIIPIVFASVVIQ
jgi:hypothetical protein